MRIGIIVCVCLLLHLLSCKKESFKTDGDIVLQFSTDTVSFDTIFTNFRTITKRLMVYNPYNESIKIDAIHLAKSDNSPFILNIEGVNGKLIEDITIGPKDSLYVFIQSFHPENGIETPLFIRDSVVFEINQNIQDVKVIAFSQDVYVFNNSVIKTQTWLGSKPYLIFGTLTIDTLEQLTIDAGVTVFMHRGANILVKGQIKAEGNFDKPIIFQGDRLDKDYKDIPGQWGGIYINPGNTNHQFIWTIIKNGTAGIQIGNPYKLDAASPSLELQNTVIQNMAYGCLLAYHAKINAGNCLIANAKSYTCYLAAGGEYQFYHTTIANFYSIYDNREFYNPAFYLSNFDTDTLGNTHILDLNNSFLRNSIIYGSTANEIKLDHKTDKSFYVSFDYCSIRGEVSANYGSFFTNTMWNKDPKFKKYEALNFELDTISPAKDAGGLEWGGYFPVDLKNKSRLNDDAPDLGAYERIE